MTFENEWRFAAILLPSAPDESPILEDGNLGTLTFNSAGVLMMQGGERNGPDQVHVGRLSQFLEVADVEPWNARGRAGAGRKGLLAGQLRQGRSRD